MSIDDDRDWAPQCYKEGVGDLIENKHFDIALIDTTNKSDIMDSLLGPLEELDGDDSKSTSSLQNMFSNKEELAHLQQLATSVSHDDMAHGDMKHGDEDDDACSFSSLLTAELIDEPGDVPSTPPATAVVMSTAEQDNDNRVLVTPTPNTKDHKKAIQSQEQQKASPGPVGVRVPEVVACIMGYIYHTDPYRQFFSQADEIVRDCIVQHQRGKHKYQNLPGAIFERFVLLFGGQRFQEIYHNAHGYVFHPQQHQQYQHQHQSAVPDTIASSNVAVPTELQLAIAYGVHLARLEQASTAVRKNSKTEQPEAATPMELIEDGVDTLTTMSEKERKMFWNYMMSQGAQ